MPFHIEYTGPAKVSTYMRVEPYTPMAELNLGHVNTTSAETAEGSQAAATPPTAIESIPSGRTLVAASSTVSVASTVIDDSASTEQGPSSTQILDESSSSVLVDTTTPPAIESSEKRFVSAFRGRTIHGLDIPIPTGYGGLILQSDAPEPSSSTTPAAKSKGKEAAKEEPPTARTTRGKTRNQTKKAQSSSGRLIGSSRPPQGVVYDVEEDDEAEKAKGNDGEDADVDMDTTEDVAAAARLDAPVKNLIPTAQFSEFRLWQPDRPVDKNKDEYFRTMQEWFSLAHEVCLFDIFHCVLGRSDSPADT